MQLTGAQALIKSLEHEGVDTIFGLPGGAILPVYDPILDSSIRHILVRHEQGAGHMATLLAGLDQWLDARGFTSLKHVRGIMSQRSLRDPQAFERANYIKILQGFRTPAPAAGGARSIAQ